MFKVGDKIVYPMHGAGTIDSIEEKEILGEKLCYKYAWRSKDYGTNSKSTINGCKKCC